MASQTPSFDSFVCAAVEIASPEARAAYVAQACGDDCDLQERVEKLVNAHFRAGNFLESPIAGFPSPVGGKGQAVRGTAAIDEPITEHPGTVIGPYKLMEQIGEGGMGLVFVAEQQQPVRCGRFQPDTSSATRGRLL
jgi:hypothetical protein